ncbi:4-(cytidine 5'-diphospho)-2-C-methyl-D-erythritol kinase [Pseudoflavonifractor phocaeensis]|uniref:4-(cytidine 5'-diphospho)-2-C-methyl-D-erythritol kinase n=1 Tax=Pseudoflavonifractor phocaeensis TaxID=1870988 RepID=UPI001F3D2FC5|nr:4-(cytidine 5'-diphospho)-2-C-methyl-D-erythritol kinase [Pseudoflavonifractor phocaeensis]MCF2660683.1 4-(cytidine 5'-diphospho)-2-C-methyl-D-erythritol kinase [Pseudoflavonifractor phocaeensis]
MEVQARAKLNLTLDVLGKRPDGYHDLKMVMQSITLADDLTLEDNGTGEIRVRSNLSFLPGGEKNLAVKAALCFYRTLGREPRGLDISLDKRVPVCAGMAGGSSDAAAVLRALNQMEGQPFSREELARVGERVGSDVPYCVLGCTALAEGRGERLTPLPALPQCWVVVCKPDFPISTPELFARIDGCKVRRRPDTDGVLAALEAGDLPEVARRMYNVFEDVLPERQRARVADIKNTLIQQGALGANMSGTGPTAFGLFEREEAAKAAFELLSQHHKETFLAQTV